MIIGDEVGRPVYQFSTDSPLRSMTGDFEAMALYAGTGVRPDHGYRRRCGSRARHRSRKCSFVSSRQTPRHRANALTWRRRPAWSTEMDDRYMGFASRDELLPALNELPVEAERAGARVTLRTAAESPDELKPLVMAIRPRPEARWCGRAPTRAGPAIGR